MKDDMASNLEKLQQLKENGVLTEEEFEKAKAKILNSESSHSDGQIRIDGLQGNPTPEELHDTLSEKGLGAAAEIYGVQPGELDRIYKKLALEMDVAEIPGSMSAGDLQKLLRQRGLAETAQELNMVAAHLDQICKKYKIATYAKQPTARASMARNPKTTNRSNSFGSELPELAQKITGGIGLVVTFIILVAFFTRDQDSNNLPKANATKPQSWEVAQHPSSPNIRKSTDPNRSYQNIQSTSEALIPYQIINRQETGTLKISFDVMVDLVDRRLPTKNELGAISKYLKAKYGNHDRTFVGFYLPGMVVGAGSFATAHHNPNMEVTINEYLIPYRYTEEGRQATKDPIELLKRKKELMEEHLVTYAAVIREVGIPVEIVDQFWSGQKGDYAHIWVTDRWNQIPKQTRLEATQSLWRAWAEIHSPSSPDKARIKILLKGKTVVGGSREKGSSIWVSD